MFMRIIHIHRISVVISLSSGSTPAWGVCRRSHRSVRSNASASGSGPFVPTETDPTRAIRLESAGKGWSHPGPSLDTMRPTTSAGDLSRAVLEPAARGGHRNRDTRAVDTISQAVRGWLLGVRPLTASVVRSRRLASSLQGVAQGWLHLRRSAVGGR